jgi:hypothetical protein
LIIRGYGLDLAQFIEFVDGDGNLVQSTDVTGLPPPPMTLRLPGVAPAFGASALRPGVTIAQEPSLGADGFRIEINPVDFGMHLNSMYDVLGVANNANNTRRVVIRTPFGTAIAPPSEWLWIWGTSPPP